jgi:type IV pilus assembly protein PilM
MAVTKGVWGIDIGQCALKALRLELIDGKPTVTAFDYVEHPKILSQPDADPDALIREALEKFLSRNQVKTDEVAIGIAGQSGLARFVKLPPVEEKKIAEIVKFEAKQQIPFPLDEVVWDFQKISGGEAVDGFALETEIGLFAMKRDVIARYLGYFTGSKVEIHTVQMSPLALVNFATYEILKKGGLQPEAAPAEGEGEDETPRGKKRCAVVMDIGTEASNLIITDGAKIIWQRPIPLGGNNFTRALTKELKLTFAKAEHLKRNAAKSPEMANILKAIKPVLTDFVGEVQRSLGYFTNTHRDAHVAYMVGLGSAFKLPGLQKYLGDKLSLEVRKPAKFARLEGEGVLNDPLFQENLLTFPVAYGLALQGLGQARLSTNLLPAEIRTDRMIRAKKPYAVAAAAMLLIGTAGLAAGFGADLKSVTDPRIKKGEEAAKSAVSAYGSQESKFNSAVGKSKDEQRAAKTIIAGQEERLNWPRFFEVLTAAMPHPGEKGNLPDAMWKGSGQAGVEALQWFERRMKTGVPIEQAMIDDASAHPKNLAMVNVEAVHTRWVTDLPGLLAAVDNAVYGDPTQKSTGVTNFGENIADTMKEDEREKDEAQGGRFKPKWTNEDKKGWVVEIRGYTDHAGGQQFVKNALLKNLQKFDDFAGKGEILIPDGKGGTIKIKNENKVGQYIVGVTDPVKGRVSHAFIYHVWKVEDALPNSFVNINTSYLNRFLPAGAAAAGGADGMGGPPRGGIPPGAGTGMPGPGSAEGGLGAAAAPAAAFGPAWSGLTGRSAGAGAAGGLGAAGFGEGMGFPPGGSSAGPVPGMPSAGGSSAGPPGMMPPGATGGTAGGATGAKEGAPERRRYEFVVMLVWREPTPSGSGTEVAAPTQ